MPPPDERWSRAVAAGRRAVERLALARPERLAGPVGEGIGAGVGQSIEFMDFREYEPGDDPRRIDWSAYARSDRLVIRRFREDVRPTVEVYLDHSASMDLEGSSKGELSLALATACLAAAARAGYAAALWRVADDWPRPVYTPERWPGFHAPSAGAPRFTSPDRSPADGAVRILISDLLIREDPGALVRRFARASRWPIVVHVLARDDITAPEIGTLRLIDRESGQTMPVEIDERVRDGFNRRATRFREACRAACRGARATHVAVVAEPTLDAAAGVEVMIRAGVLVGR